MAVAIVSYASPVIVTALWRCARRLRRSPAFIPALFATLVAAAVLVVPAAQGRQPLAPCALVVAMALAGAGIADMMRCDAPPGGEEGDDRGGGGGGRGPDVPSGPGGSGLQPEWWESFEDAFWAHVGASRRELTPAG